MSHPSSKKWIPDRSDATPSRSDRQRSTDKGQIDKGRDRLLPIPKGLNQSAQGRAERATLGGQPHETIINPERVAAAHIKTHDHGSHVAPLLEKMDSRSFRCNPFGGAENIYSWFKPHLVS
jgi:hypothetical protein